MSDSFLKLVDLLTNRKRRYVGYLFFFGSILAGCVYAVIIYYDSSTEHTMNLFLSDTLMISIMIGFSFPLMLTYMLYQKAHDIKKHGTARFAFSHEIATHTNPKPNSVVIGGTNLKYDKKNPDRFKGTYLFDDSPAPVSIIAPNRSGKNVGFTIPSLLWWNDSAVVYDIRGEHYKYTAGARERYAGRSDGDWKDARGSRILAFNPTARKSVGEKYLASCGFNPLQEIPLGTADEISAVQDIAQMIIDADDKQSGSSVIFSDNAVILLTGAILQTLYMSRINSRTARITQADLNARSVRIRNDNGSKLVCDDGQPVEPPCMGSVLDTLSDVKAILDVLVFNEDETSDDDAKGIKSVFKKWVLTPHSEAFSYEVEPWWGMASTYHPQIQQIAAEMMAKPSRELGSIVSTAVSKLGMFRDPNIRRNTSESVDHSGNPWAISELMDDDDPTTLYILPSPDSRERLKPLVRLLFMQIINRFTRGHDVKRKRKLLLLIDEFPSLGRIKQLEAAFSVIAGYGIKPFLVMQTIKQLYSIYGENESIIANSRIRIACAPADERTAKFLSDAVGVQTFSRRNRSRTTGTVARPGSRTASTDLSARPLLTPDEVMRLKLMKPEKGIPGECLIIEQGEPTIKGHTPIYFCDPFMSKLTNIEVPFSNVLVLDGYDETPELVVESDDDSTTSISELLVGEKEQVSTKDDGPETNLLTLGEVVGTLRP